MTSSEGGGLDVREVEKELTRIVSQACKEIAEGRDAIPELTVVELAALAEHAITSRVTLASQRLRRLSASKETLGPGVVEALRREVEG